MMRPGNVIAASVLTFMGAFVAGGLTEHHLEVTAAVVATGLAVGAGNAINDYFDREIDRINQPDRAIPRGAVSPRGALLWSGVLFAGAVALALTLPRIAIAIAGVNLVALIAYTEYFKGLPGVGNVGAVTVLFLLAAVATLTREIIKDVEDVEGDREEGLNTLPIAVGERRALYVAVALLILAVLASPVPYLLGYFGVVYLLLVIPADAVMLYASYESFEDPTAGQSHLKYGMFLATVAFVAGRVAVETNVV